MPELACGAAQTRTDQSQGVPASPAGITLGQPETSPVAEM